MELVAWNNELAAMIARIFQVKLPPSKTDKGLK